MKNKPLLRKGTAFAVIVLFVGANFISCIGGKNKIVSNTSNNNIEDSSENIYIDLVTRNIGSDDDITVYLGNGDGTFGNRRDYYIGQEPRQIAAGDFNNDYNLDIVITNLDKNYLSFLYGYGNGTFQDAQNYNVGHTTYAVFPYDFNSDGDLDLALGNYNQDNLSIMLGNGDGTFMLHYGCNIGNGPFRMLGEDLNNDDEIDLIITILHESYFCILYGYGNGTFGPRVDIPIGAPSTYMTSGDYNDDQYMDFAIIRYAGMWNEYISVFLNLENGTFHRQDYPSGASRIKGISTGDFDNDGILDLASTESRNYPDYRVRILFGNGNGTFGNEKFIPTGNSPSSIVSKDLNGDQNIDLGVLHGADDDISIFFGDGTGNFSPRVIYPVGRSPRWLIAECFRTAPFAPTIEGQTSGKAGVEYEYTVVAVDPNGNSIWYYVDWGDNTSSGWIGPFSSGEKIKVSHTWNDKRTYMIKAKVNNTNDKLSPWGELEVSMPKNKPFIFNFHLIRWLFERFPILQKILDVLRLNIR